MRQQPTDELQAAREAYRSAMRRYGEFPTQEARLEWMRAQRRLAEAVCGQLGVAI